MILNYFKIRKYYSDLGVSAAVLWARKWVCPGRSGYPKGMGRGPESSKGLHITPPLVVRGGDQLEEQNLIALLVK